MTARTDQLYLLPNQVVQLHPQETRNPMFAGCLLTVTELKSWGVQGYVQALGSDDKPGGQAYYRAKWSEIVPLDKYQRVEWSCRKEDDDDGTD